MSFEDWMDEVERLFKYHYGCSSDDVEDWSWYLSWDNGEMPGEAFAEWEADMQRFL